MRRFRLRPSALFFRLFVAAATLALGLAIAGLWPRQGARRPAPPASVAPARAEVSVRDTLAVEAAEEDAVFEGRYENYVYGYSVEIPSGMVGAGSTPPAPQHGFGIDLDHPRSTAWRGRPDFPKSYLYVDGSYNSYDLDQLYAVADTHLRYLRENRRNVRVRGRKTTRLGGLTATRVVAWFEEDGVEMVSDEIIAFRRDGGEATAVYRLSLSTPLANYERDRPVLEAVRESWHLQPVE